MILLLAWYLIPVLRGVTRWLPAPAPHSAGARIVGVLGRLEWGIALLRDQIGLAGWMVVGAVHGGRMLGLWQARVPEPLVVVALGSVVLSLVARRYHTRWRLRVIDTMVAHPNQHPQEIHDRYFSGLAWWMPALPTVPPRCLTLATLDFRRGGQARRRLWPLLHAAASTVFYSSLVLLAARTPGYRDRLRDIVDAIMRGWGARLLDLARVGVHVEGLERLAAVDGTVILCANHTSVLDFVVLPVVMGYASLRRMPLHLRFLVAKDHFLDNWFYYRGLRIGLAVQAAGMVFVHRHGTPDQRRHAVDEAVRQMFTGGLDVAVYPHGTRTPARVTDDGERVEPGYFTAGWPARRRPPGQHLKKGTARLACQAALQAGGASVYVVPIGVRGAGIALPKGAARIQTEGLIAVRIGEPICAQVDAANVSLHVDRLHEEIDDRLRELLQVDEHLLACFHDDVRRDHDDETATRLTTHLRQWHAAYVTGLAVLDLIAQQHAHARPPLVRQLCHIIAQRDAAALHSLYRTL